MAGAVVPNGHDTLWFEAWFLVNKDHRHFQGKTDATWGIHVAYDIWGYHISPRVHIQTSSHLQVWLLGSEKTHWWVKREHGKKLHAILGVVSGRFNDQVSERVHMPWPPVHPKKSMVVRKRIPYNCLWFDTGVVPDGDLKRQVLYVSTAIKIIVGLGGNCRSNLAIDKTIVARCQACYPWEWVLRLESNSWVAEEGSVCLGTHQEAPLLAKIY